MVSKEIQKKFLAYKEKYSDKYSKEAWKYIEEHFFENIHNSETPDILMQIYTELGIVPPIRNFYHKHLRLLKRIFPLDGNLVEVASGRMPALANLIAGEQRKIGKGTITIYEPLLVEMTPKYPNMTLHKEYFYKDTDISDADLVVGVMPCESTELILENAIKNNKDFYVAMCGCVHSPLDYMFGFYSTSPKIYQEQVISNARSLLKENGDGTLEITKIKNTPFDYPILYRKK